MLLYLHKYRKYIQHQIQKSTTIIKLCWSIFCSANITLPPILLHYFLKAQYTTWKITWVTALWFRRLFVPQSFCKPFYLYVLRPWHQYFSGLQGCLIISKVALGMINHPNKVTYWLCKKKGTRPKYVRCITNYVWVLGIIHEWQNTYNKRLRDEKDLKAAFFLPWKQAFKPFSLNELCVSGTGKNQKP